MMARRGWLWVVIAAVGIGAAGTGMGKAHAAVDCWLLDGDRKEQAADSGLCGDAFSRNSKPGEPPTLGPTASLPEAPLPPPPPTVTPSRKPVPKAASVRSRSHAGGPHASRRMPVQTAQARSGGDFFDSLQRDFGKLVDLLGGDASQGTRRAGNGGSSYPSHSGR
ncbi:hypothetical protein J2847_003377 [Azospirillum agricola]|nr:hypothetical protein [Azospirillum agricola]MBP2230074.1 hypothetical protein [Azospirillum agricola]